ncbi:histidine phosphotransferase family protein [Tropicibacter sp. Alg240-R139]|uniref:histidine phosphotransferase family protein n=1 Tax=Tropicibacter sp. Alg240-R139 TaxID=2305991 RepID=UPI0013DF5D83|nr:histidine phosphotransferase family protein [Tropicibacter sp. Alg240-R139]
MGESNVNLAALIGSRICHDLISPIGAITNGLELLDMAGAVEGPEMDLIADSVGNAGARIRFFRIAYGAAGEQQIGQAEISSLLADVNRGNRIQAHWGPIEPVSRSDVRMAFLALQCCETALPFGGDVHVTRQDDEWRITGTGSKIATAIDLWEGLFSAAGPVQVSPAQVQFALLPAVAAEMDRRLAYDQDDTQITIRY